MSMQPPPPMSYDEPPPKKETNWWLIGCGGCLGLVLLGAIAGGLIFMGAMKKVKSSDAYAYALSSVQGSPEVQEKLGTPIVAGKYAAGTYQDSNETGSAGFFFQVQGPKSGGKAIYAAQKQGGKWQVISLVVVVDATGETIELVKQNTSSTPSNASSEDEKAEDGDDDAAAAAEASAPEQTTPEAAPAQ
jgi:hypothetical protein